MQHKLIAKRALMIVKFCPEIFMAETFIGLPLLLDQDPTLVSD